MARKRGTQPPLEFLYPYVVFIFIGYCAADLTAITFRELMLPTEAPPTKPAKIRRDSGTRGSYTSITSRNIFSADGTIPEALALKNQKKEESTPEVEQAPVPSNLPLNLVGTIVHSNPEKSIANIEIKAKSAVLAVRVGKDIDKLATLLNVERGKAYIRNLNNNRLEYIEMKGMGKLSFAAAKNPTEPSAKTQGKQEVKQTAPNRFEINRADVLKYTSDMSTVLQQAAMQPRRKANGEIDGFKFLNIQPNSIYSQLGFQVGDVIKSVNGEPVDSPAKAMEMYNTLKGSNSIKIGVERDGRDQENDYSIK